MNKIFKLSIFCFLVFACQNDGNKTVEENGCEIDPFFLQNYLNDINSVVVFSIRDEQNFQAAYNSFVNLEVLSGSQNIDSLSSIFHNSSDLKDNLNVYLSSWLEWLDKNRCTTNESVKEKFSEVKKNYPLINYGDKEFIKKLKIKNAIFLKSIDFSSEEIDTILVDKYNKSILEAPPLWR